MELRYTIVITTWPVINHRLLCDVVLTIARIQPRVEIEFPSISNIQILVNFSNFIAQVMKFLPTFFVKATGVLFRRRRPV